MASTEGSQCYISQSTPLAIDIRQSYPQDFFRLRINSNDTYSRSEHPNNNCHNFTIEFPQGSAEAIQYRIAQCNRYQIVDFRTPVRNNKGTIVHNNTTTTTTNNTQRIPFYSQIIKFPLLNTAALSQKMTRSEGGTLMMTKFGLLIPNQYEKTHEELETLNLIMECSSLNSQETMNELNFMHHLPPSQ